MEDARPELQAAADAFGREPPSFWQRLRGADSAAPKRATGAVAFVTGFVLLAIGSAGHGIAAKLGAVFVLVVPGAALERFYRARRRRKQEELLPRAGER